MQWDKTFNVAYMKAKQIDNMKPMPTSRNEMLKEATSLGLVPTPMKDLKVTPRIKLLQYAYDSYKASRSFNRTSMIVLGTTGSGKSSIVNHLLGVDIAKISNSMSETRMTSEFVLTAEDPELDVSDLSLVSTVKWHTLNNLVFCNKS